MRRRRDEQLYSASDQPEDEFSLEAILAEYGGGGRQPAPAETETPEEPEEVPAAPESAPEPEIEPGPEPEPASEPEYESTAPDRVALKDIMSQTVDAVLEDEDDGVIAQPVPLGERIAALLDKLRRPAGKEKRRPVHQDTEQLFDEPEEEEPEPEEPPEPEPQPPEAAAPRCRPPQRRAQAAQKGDRVYKERSARNAGRPRAAKADREAPGRRWENARPVKKGKGSRNKSGK